MLGPVSYSVVDTPGQVKAGKVFEVIVKDFIDGKWYLYLIAMIRMPDLIPPNFLRSLRI